ncbi:MULTISPECIES: ABC transporter permease subunit [unclassified Bacillus cereus group]|uniref:ABC transporter permease subunit n=1 Tax=unclassified Bacillus cereus group TaxID=2750818 RepID=UPI001F58C800|nr:MULTISPECIES: ABC transporter permease subunit [unclassified Bacillus cereus group]
MKNKFIYNVLPWILPVILLILWQLISTFEVISTNLFPLPLTVLQSAWTLITSGQLLYHMEASLGRALIGTMIGGTIGFLLGVSNGVSKVSHRVSDTTIQMIRNVPHLALVPLVIIWMGVDEGAKIFLVALGVMFPVYINTYHGIRTVDPGFIEMGKMYGLNRWQQFTRILLPGALPSIFLGVRYALGVMWLTLIVAETLATQRGIGYLATNAREFMQADIIIISIVLYALFGKTADLLAYWGERKALRWHPNYRKQ